MRDGNKQDITVKGGVWGGVGVEEYNKERAKYQLKEHS